MLLAQSRCQEGLPQTTLLALDRWRTGCCFAASLSCSQASLRKCHRTGLTAVHCCLQAEAAGDRAELLQAQLEEAAEGSDSLDAQLQERELLVSSVRGKLQHTRV